MFIFYQLDTDFRRYDQSKKPKPHASPPWQGRDRVGVMGHTPNLFLNHFFSPPIRGLSFQARISR
jgi:hypothetical protein